MVLSIPVCVSTCANAATSPIQVGMAGEGEGWIWTVTVGGAGPRMPPSFLVCARRLRHTQTPRFHDSLIEIHKRQRCHGTYSKTLLAKVSITSASFLGSLTWHPWPCPLREMRSTLGRTSATAATISLLLSGLRSPQTIATGRFSLE